MPASTSRRLVFTLLTVLTGSLTAATVQTFSPQGEVAKVRQARATFSEPMVRFGDARLGAPLDLRCAGTPPGGTGRWVDDRTWVYDFTQDVPAGSRCGFVLKTGLKSVAGEAVTGTSRFDFSTGGPAVVRAYPEADESTEIEEDQMFALLLNGAATAASIERHGYCEVAGIRERVPLAVVTGADRDAILQAVNLTAQQARVVTVRCARPLPNDARVSLVWGRGIATPSGVANSKDRRLDYTVRPPFTATFTCERTSARADCLPIRPLRIEFSSPVPRKLAEQIVLTAPDGKHRPDLEHRPGETRERLISVVKNGLRQFYHLVTRRSSQGKGQPAADSAVSAVEFKGPLPEHAAIRIELPKDLRDDAGRTLSNASAFPLNTRTADAPPLAKFPAATFGILELHAEPVLPVAVRHVEGAMNVRDLTLHQDADIIAWLARVKRYNESRLPRTQVQSELGIKLPPPAALPDVVQTRTVSLLKRQANAKALKLPEASRTDPHPFEVIGIPMPQPGFHVVEIESTRLGQALLDRQAPMYVRTSVLVTNLGVHFKWGATNSAVWVTTLDKARPVASAQVQVSDCRGARVWAGRTNGQGLALIPQELPRLPWDYCQGKGGGEQEDGYFISARQTDAQGRADLAFVWSNWNQGIESWRFHIDTSGMDSVSPKIYHSVLDRTLLRAGQTVSMKHLARREQITSLALVPRDELPTQVRIVHEGSGQKFEFPLTWRAGRYAETVFKIPEDAKLGLYDITLFNERESFATGSFRVEEFRLPVMTGRIVGPKATLVQPRDVPLGLQINYGNGGGAAALPVRVSAQLRDTDVRAALRTERYPGFRFDPPRQPREASARSLFDEDYVDEDDNVNSQGVRDGGARLVADKLPVTLDQHGAGNVSLSKLPEVTTPRELLVQATYADPNGEVQTLSQTLPVWPSAVVLGLRTDSWVSVKQKLTTQVLALDTRGQPQAGVRVKVRAVAHRVDSTRKRLVGGFYSYDNQSADDNLGEVCMGVTDALGLLVCEPVLNATGEVELIAQAQDNTGHVSRSAASIWVTHQDEIWFGSENQDRMDVIPEQRSYEAGQTAKFQVRSPFRHATALIAIERNGILETRIVELNGQDPTVELAVKAEWAPNVYVSVLAVRGRIREVPWYSFFTWGWRAPSEWWRAYTGEGQLYQAPTAMVDLARPAFKYGIAEIEVGSAAHQLKVEVSPDKSRYPIRATSQVRVKVTLPNGRPAPAGTEVALAAVDEALLELSPNSSWDVLQAMIRHRGYGVETATAQMQIIGKRHYGKKAAPPGGGGGQFPTRELFDTLLLWNPRVVLDANGQAVVPVPLNDSLTSFRIVAIADAAHDLALFGTGQASIRATQDLQILSGTPPLVREGDRYQAMFTLRNTTNQPMNVALSATMGDTALPAQGLRIAANAAAEAHWDVTVPSNLKQLDWTVTAQAGTVQDRMNFVQKVAEAVPVTVQQATLMQLDKAISIPVAAPRQALSNAQGAVRGGIDVAFKPRLADGLPGVRGYFERYPWTCLEQKASVAIGLRDATYWRSIADQIPLYLDDDGLANYFPPDASTRHSGSDSLTAYLLSISDAASQLGYDFTLGEDVRSQMERGLIAFVEGRLKRDFWVPAFLKRGDLDVRKLAAIEALSRTGKAPARLLESIQILPNQWPTGAVIDWLMILDRIKDVPERDQRIAEAEQILRARLNVQGTRLGFSTERDDSWWWLMTNGDVNSVRLIEAVLTRPAWKDDLPRLVTGTLQRQQQGHWSTTVANAWGSVAVEAFSKRFERTPVGGTSRAGLLPGPAPKALNWAQSPQGATLSLGWPPASNKADTSVKVTHEGSGAPWLTVTSRAAVPLVTPVSSGYRISKTITPIEQKVKGRYSRGDVLRVHIDIDAQADMSWVVLNDPIPGGASLLGSGLGRDDVIAGGAEKVDNRGWLAYQERSFEAFRAYYRYLPKGPFSIEYTVRLNNPGQFGLPPTRVEAMYAPEMFGQAPNAVLAVTP